jgi:hypothetical protein
MDDSSHHSLTRSRTGRFWLVLGLVGALGLVLLWEQHQDHFLSALPWLILLACPLMHVFMHGGHHGHGKHGNDQDS